MHIICCPRFRLLGSSRVVSKLLENNTHVHPYSLLSYTGINITVNNITADDNYYYTNFNMFVSKFLDPFWLGDSCLFISDVGRSS